MQIMRSETVQNPYFFLLLVAALVACNPGPEGRQSDVDWSSFDYRSSEQRGADYDSGYQAPYAGPEDTAGCTTDGINILCR